MAVPKRKKSKSKTKMGRANKNVKLLNVSIDKETGEYRLGHNVTPNGFYKGKKIIKDKVKKESSESSQSAE